MNFVQAKMPLRSVDDRSLEQEINKDLIQAEQGQKTDLTETAEKLRGSIQVLNLEAGSKMTPEARKTSQAQRQVVSGMTSRVNALVVKANNIPWLRPVVCTALGVIGVATLAFIAQKIGTAPLTPPSSSGQGSSISASGAGNSTGVGSATGILLGAIRSLSIEDNLNPLIETTDSLSQQSLNSSSLLGRSSIESSSSLSLISSISTRSSSKRSSSNSTTNVYRNNLKNREFGEEAPQNFCLERASIAARQGASENKKFETKPTMPKTNSSGCFGIVAPTSSLIKEAKPDTAKAAETKEQGRVAREVFERARGYRPEEFMVGGAEDRAYRQGWQLKERCPSDLNDFADYQIGKGYLPKFSVESLQNLFGDKQDLTDQETRNLYLTLDGSIGHLFNESNPARLKTQLTAEGIAAFGIRDTVRKYTRLRTNDSTLCWYERLVAWWYGGSKNYLESRDYDKYGTTEPGHPDFVIGRNLQYKDGQPDESATIAAAIAKAQTTNKEYNKRAREAALPCPTSTPTASSDPSESPVLQHPHVLGGATRTDYPIQGRTKLEESSLCRANASSLWPNVNMTAITSWTSENIAQPLAPIFDRASNSLQWAMSGLFSKMKENAGRIGMYGPLIPLNFVAYHNDPSRRLKGSKMKDRRLRDISLKAVAMLSDVMIPFADLVISSAGSNTRNSSPLPQRRG